MMFRVEDPELLLSMLCISSKQSEHRAPTVPQVFVLGQQRSLLRPHRW